MDWINELRKLNNKLLVSTNDEKYQIIAKILEDDQCFLKMDISVAFDILKSLGLENIPKVYGELLEQTDKKGKIKIID